VIKSFYRIVGTFFYSGRFPFAPGTAGSLAALLLLWLAAHFLAPASFSLLQSAGLLLMVLVGIPAASFLEQEALEKDPSCAVIDEAAGQWLAFLFIPSNLITGPFWIPLAGFFLFRFFDIAKVWPANIAERLPGGVGIMADDLIAGLYACIILNLLVHIIL